MIPNIAVDAVCSVINEYLEDWTANTEILKEIREYLKQDICKLINKDKIKNITTEYKLNNKLWENFYIQNLPNEDNFELLNSKIGLEINNKLTGKLTIDTIIEKSKTKNLITFDEVLEGVRIKLSNEIKEDITKIGDVPFYKGNKIDYNKDNAFIYWLIGIEIDLLPLDLINYIYNIFVHNADVKFIFKDGLSQEILKMDNYNITSSKSLFTISEVLIESYQDHVNSLSSYPIECKRLINYTDKWKFERNEEIDTLINITNSNYNEELERNERVSSVTGPLEIDYMKLKIHNKARFIETIPSSIRIECGITKVEVFNNDKNCYEQIMEEDRNRLIELSKINHLKRIAFSFPESLKAFKYFTGLLLIKNIGKFYLRNTLRKCQWKCLNDLSTSCSLITPFITNKLERHDSFIKCDIIRMLDNYYESKLKGDLDPEDKWDHTITYMIWNIDRFGISDECLEELVKKVLRTPMGAHDLFNFFCIIGNFINSLIKGINYKISFKIKVRLLDDKFIMPALYYQDDLEKELDDVNKNYIENELLTKIEVQDPESRFKILYIPCYKDRVVMIPGIIRHCIYQHKDFINDINEESMKLFWEMNEITIKKLRIKKNIYKYHQYMLVTKNEYNKIIKSKDSDNKKFEILFGFDWIDYTERLEVKTKADNNLMYVYVHDNLFLKVKKDISHTKVNKLIEECLKLLFNKFINKFCIKQGETNYGIMTDGLSVFINPREMEEYLTNFKIWCKIITNKHSLNDKLLLSTAETIYQNLPYKHPKLFDMITSKLSYYRFERDYVNEWQIELSEYICRYKARNWYSKDQIKDACKKWESINISNINIKADYRDFNDPGCRKTSDSVDYEDNW
jgi:hypothetical protein